MRADDIAVPLKWRDSHLLHGRYAPAICALRLTEPIAWPGTCTAGPIGRIGKFASVNRKTTTADAFSQSGPETMELGDLPIDSFHPCAGEVRPVSACGDAIGRKFGEFRANFVKR